MSGMHGGIDVPALREAGIDPDRVLDFSVSINPASLPQDIQEIIRRSAIYRYPDSRSRIMVEALAREYGPDPSELLVVNGTSQAIYLIAATALGPGKTTLIAAPTYSEYRDAAEVFGARIVALRAPRETGYRFDIEALIRAIRTERPSVFWICSPNNPTGAWLDPSEVGRLRGACRDAGALMVLDEAYRCFAPPGLLGEEFHPGVVHLRSMTKDFCIPGLRLGWLRGDAAVVAELMRRQPEWSVSAPAQDAGTACLGRLEYFEKSWADTRRETDRMAGELRRLGLNPLPSAANFLLVNIGDDAAVKGLSRALWTRLIQVRDCASFGLEGYIRIGTRSPADTDVLIDALGELL